MSQVNTLFENIEPFSTGYLEVDEHKIYYEECGNPNGKPAVFLHGGPGGGGSTKVRGFFNPELFRIVVFDQRGCGRSKPHACLKNNTTWNLVEDIEMLKEKLKIKKWLIFGGSWGSTLALAYAQTYPNSVSELVLRGIFMLRDKELKWFYQDGASRIFPEAWEGFLKPINQENRHNLMDAYYKIFTGDDDEKKMEAAVAWSKWEGSVSTLSHKADMVSSYSESKFALAFALIENHYFVNKGFLDSEDQLIASESIDKIRHIPAKIIQGRYDIVCPMETAWELKKNWPEAELIVAPSSGHSAFEKEITFELVRATEEFAKND